MKHPIQINITKLFPTRVSSHSLPADYLQQIEYAFPTYWEHPDFSILTQEYHNENIYLNWIEIKTEKQLQLNVKCIRADILWTYQLRGTILIRQEETRNQLENIPFCLKEDKYAIFYSSPRAYTVTIKPGHHFIFLYANTAAWQDHQKEMDNTSSTSMPITAPIYKALNHFANLPRKDPLKQKPMVYNSLMELLLLSHDHLKEKIYYKINFNQSIIYNIRRYIEKHIQTGDLPSITELAEKFNISVQNLRVNHKKVFGCSLQRYITGKRLTAATTLLKTTNYPINEIASILNYDTNTFLRQFKRYYNLTPSDYRKK